MPGEALIGIFWFVCPKDGPLAMPMRTCPLSEAAEYGDCLTLEDGHAETWQAWRTGRLPLVPSSATLRQVMALSEYEEWPRGRIVHERTSGRFVIYADRQAFPYQSRIINAFRLPSAQTQMRTDAHYRSTRRITVPSGKTQ